MTDRSLFVAEIEALSRLERHVRVFELSYPRSLHRLAAVRAAVRRKSPAEI